MTHGHTRGRRPTPTWVSWHSMKQRVRGQVSPENYAQRGIGMDPRWEAFENFLADMGERPPGTSIERIRNDEGYSPGNCRWATPTEQLRNTRVNHILEHDGARRPIVEWAELIGINNRTILNRLRLGWSVADALTVPVGARKGHARPHCAAGHAWTPENTSIERTGQGDNIARRCRICRNARQRRAA